MSFFSDKKVAVTGCCGTVGSELVRQLYMEDVGDLVCLDNNESELFFLEQRYFDRGKGVFWLADIRDASAMEQALKGVDIVFHAAAYKHVIVCERSPFQAVQTNIIGVQNIIRAAQRNKISKVIFTSSDKAVNPTNVMGTSKLMGERLITAANCNRLTAESIFASTRFGNVLGSRGSVIPIFRKQIEKGGPVTLTDPSMTRFIMSIESAVNLLLDSAKRACGGEVFVTKMPVIRIEDLAKAMIDSLAPSYGYDPASIEITKMGRKPGEKLYEELMSEEERGRTWELEEYFVILPAFRSVYQEVDYSYKDIVSRQVDNTYNSANVAPLDTTDIIQLLTKQKLLDIVKPKEHPDQRHWP